MRSNWKWFGLGAITALIIVLIINFCYSYEKNVHKMLGIIVSYKCENITTHLSSDICDHITTAKRTKIIFDKLPSQEKAIKINAPDRAILYIYPSDEDSIIIRYEPRNGLKRTYKKSGYGDFNLILQFFYELTDNEVFNETIEY